MRFHLPSAPFRPAADNSPSAAVLVARIGAAIATAGVLALGGCGSNTSTDSASGGSTQESGQPSASASAPASKATTGTCSQRIAQELTMDQKAGQLVMPALMAQDGQSGLDTTITKKMVTGIFYLGKWKQAEVVKQASAHVQSMAPSTPSGKIGMIIGADQEGGNIQQLQGDGFPNSPSALQLGQQSTSAVTASATTMGKALKGAGVNVDLAPVADTVPTEMGKKNDPIGRWDRQFGSDPASVSTHALAFAQALQAQQVQPVVKHFPGIGRITANTDLSATGITDTVATSSDPYLAPFTAAIKAKLPMVMMSNAKYSKLDANNPAPFSSAIVTDLLRKKLGFSGVVLSDDLGVAKAVAATPVKERAAKFIAAGGDIALTGHSPDVPEMIAGIVERAGSDAAFAKQVDASVNRVLEMKAKMNLLTCS